jgi:hypothetical protein
MKPQSLDAAYERRAMEEGLVKEPVFDENKFWMWLMDNGYHNEDYILDNLAELEMLYEDSI